MLSSLHFKFTVPWSFLFFHLSAVVSRMWQLGAFLLDLPQLHPIINYRGKMIGWFLCICTATGVCYYQPNMLTVNTRLVLLKCKAPSWKAIAAVVSEWLTERMFLHGSNIPRTGQNPLCSPAALVTSWQWGSLRDWVVLPVVTGTPS